jgi:hypothetical protein
MLASLDSNRLEGKLPTAAVTGSRQWQNPSSVVVQSRDKAKPSGGLIRVSKSRAQQLPAKSMRPGVKQIGCIHGAESGGEVVTDSRLVGWFAKNIR